MACPVEFANSAYIAGEENKIHLNQDRCILCGNCLEVCDHGARTYLDDTEALIADLQKGESVSVIFTEDVSRNILDFQNVLGTLKAIGVRQAFNEFWGKEINAWCGQELSRQRKAADMISSENSVVVRCLQQYFPERLPELAPVQSPLACLMIYLRSYLQIKDKLCFLLNDIEQVPVITGLRTEDIYYVTLPRLKACIEEKNLHLAGFAEEDNPFAAFSGEIKDLFVNRPKEVPVKRCLWSGAGRVGLDKVLNTAQAIKSEREGLAPNELWRYFAERIDPHDFSAAYVPETAAALPELSPEDYETIFAKMRKTTEEAKRVNCNACGYQNCYLMAKAIFHGFNQKENCLYYNQQVAKELKIYEQRTEETMELLEEIIIKSEELTEANEKLKEMDKVKTDFISTVSHELRTPLTSVLGFANIIKKRLEDVIFPQIHVEDKKVLRTMSQVRENVGIIIAEGTRLTSLINDVLDIAKMEAGKTEWKMEKLSVEEILNRAMMATTSLFEQKALELVKEVDENLPDILGDKDRLIQVVINLLSNAVKFTDTGKVTCRAVLDKNMVKVSVVDSGIGIEARDLEAVFEKFKQVGDTLTDKPKGTGLGLPICKQIIEHHKGRIWAESTLGMGSTFSFVVPALLTEKAIEEESAEQLMVQQLKNHLVSVAPLKNGEKNVLVVDDESSIRELLKQEFEEEGYNVTEAKDGFEALEKIKIRKPDIVILDVMMPLMNGFDVVAVIKNNPETKDIPIIILSILEDIQRGFQVGVDKYLNKPIDVENLKKEVKTLVDHGKTKKDVLIVNKDDPTLKTLVGALKTKGFTETEMLDYQLNMDKVTGEISNIMILDAKLAERCEVAKTIKFSNGSEEVLIVIYANKNDA
jgi:signal transduction histidine kinase/DNA-binding response OmpR family regulator/ferredoxin